MAQQTNYRVIGDVSIPPDASDEEWADAWLHLIETHDVSAMCVDGRPLTNIEMLAGWRYWQKVDAVTAWIESLDRFLTGDSDDEPIDDEAIRHDIVENGSTESSAG